MSLLTFLVEDDPTIRLNLMAAMAEVADARFVGTAESEAEAVAWLAGHAGQWNLAVVDLFIKDGSGFGVIDSLPAGRANRERVVVLTNSATPENRIRAIERGADAVFDKSLELDAFFDYCRRAGASALALG